MPTEPSVDPSEAAGALLSQASAEHRQGRTGAALALLEQALRLRPDDPEIHNAYGICLTDTGRFREAQSEFGQVLILNHGHVEAAYRLARLLDADGNWEQAARCYRQVLALSPGFRDTAARLQTCQDALAAAAAARTAAGRSDPHAVSGPTAPPSLRSLVLDGRQDASRGTLKYSVNLRPHHLAPEILGRAALAVLAVAPSPLAWGGLSALETFLLAAALLLLPRRVTWIVLGAEAVALIALAAESGDSWTDSANQTHYHLPTGGVLVLPAADTSWPGQFPITEFLPLLLLVVLFVGVPVAALKSVTYGADIYEYGVDVKQGLFKRTIQFIWYYQIVESPTYVRNFGNYFTQTASIGIRYNEAGASSSKYVELPGLGTPDYVRTVLGHYLEARIPPERVPMRGPWA